MNKNTPIRLFVIYENPQTSEVTAEFDSLSEALAHPARPGAEIIRNGITLAKEAGGVWERTWAAEKHVCDTDCDPHMANGACSVCSIVRMDACYECEQYSYHVAGCRRAVSRIVSSMDR